MHEDAQRNFQQALSDLRKVLPILQKHCPEFGQGLYMLVDEESGAVTNKLDMIAGYDGYQYYQCGIRGIAARAQRCDGVSFRTFTIRTDLATGTQTEYDKRLWAVTHRNEGAMYPYWTLQSYSTQDGSQVVSIGLCKTEELYLFIEEQEKCGDPFESHTAGQEAFIEVSWNRYKKSGNYFYEYDARIEPLKKTG